VPVPAAYDSAMPVGEMTTGERIGLIVASVIVVPALILTFLAWQTADGSGTSFALMVFLAVALSVRWYREYAATQRQR